MTTLSIRPVTRETTARVRDKGSRAVIATITGGIIELRAKGLRSRENLCLAWCYEQAVKQRIAEARAAKKAARRSRK